jgi:hypothetical protein
LLKWIVALFEGRSAVEKRRDNPVLLTTVTKSAEIYERLHLNQFIDAESSDQLARQFYVEIDTVCNAAEPLAAVRGKLAETMLRFALYQTLMLGSDFNEDPAELLDCAGISGELAGHLDQLARKNIALRADIHESEHFTDDVDLWSIVKTEYWKTYWFLETLNAARTALGDVLADNDWYRPFMHAACANQENLYRIDLDLPSAFDPDIAHDAAAAYSIFTDIVVSGAKDPLAEWRDYHAGTQLPEPGHREKISNPEQ